MSYSTNWSEMPMEIRALCIRKMDFQSKMRMRRTSSIEKALVDSRKHAFDDVILRQTSGELVVEAHEKNGVIYTRTEEMIERMLHKIHHDITPTEFIHSLILSIFRHGKVSHLMIDNFSQEDPDLIDQLSTIPDLRVPILRFYQMSNGSIHDFIEVIKGPYKLLDIAHCTDRAVNRIIRDPLVHSRILKAEQVQFDVTSCPDPHIIPHFWIGMDSRIGAMFRMDLNGPHDQLMIDSAKLSFLTDFTEKFPGRVISSTDNETRIRTDNPLKHIIFKFYDCHIGDHEKCATAVCQVIPAEMKMEDFEKESGWVEYDDLLEN